VGVVAAGSLNKRVTIERKVPGKDAAGQPIQSWVEVCTVWGRVRTQTGFGFVHAEFIASDAETVRTTASIRIRFRNGLDTTMRVKVDGVIYEIKAILPDTTGKEFTDIAVAVGANQG